LVDQPSWTSTSPMTLLIRSQGTGTRDLRFHLFENGSLIPELTVTWTAGAALVAGARYYRSQL
jgi:hypothetical protein